MKLNLNGLPFGVGRIVRHGTDVTVVAASLMVHEAERAADQLATLGISVEVVDVVRELSLRIANRADRPRWNDSSFFKRFANPTPTSSQH